MAEKLETNIVVEWDNYWNDEIVPACIRSFLTRYLERPMSSCKNGKAINCFAHHPEKGFLKQNSRKKKAAELTDDDYLGFVTEDMYSQIDSKINSLYSGTGTESAKKVVSAFNGATFDAAHEWEGAYTIFYDAKNGNLTNYLPHANSSGTQYDGKTKMTAADLALGMCLMGIINSYAYAGNGIGGGIRRKFMLGTNSLNPMGVAFVQPVKVQGKRKYRWQAVTNNSAFSSAAPWMGSSCPNKKWTKLSDFVQENSKKVKKNLEKNGLEYVGGGSVDKCWFWSEYPKNRMTSWQDSFVDRIARNHPLRIEGYVDEILNGILADLELSEPPWTENPAFETTPDPPPPPPRKDKKKSLGKEYGKFLVPFDLQCFLMENINFLSTIKDGAPPYKHLGRVYTRHGVGGNPGNVVSVINHGFKDLEIATLLEMCPDMYASLVPSIEVYRVDYEGKDILQPTREVKIPFPNFIDPSDIDLIGEGLLGRIPGAGIKSFTWNLEGVNPAEVDNNITANLTLYFQTIQDLFSLNRTESGEYNFQAGNKEPGYLDLIIGSGTSFRDSPVKTKNKPPRNASICDVESEVYDGAKFRIKVIVGWNSPSLEALLGAFPSLTDRGAKAFKSAIESTKQSLYLQITRHELNFNENGSVELSIDYQAALSGILKAPIADIFDGDTRYQTKLDDLEEDIETLEKRAEERAEAVGGQGLSKSDQDKLDKKLEEAIDLEEKDKMVKYRRFLEKLYDKDKIYCMNISAETYRQGLISSKEYSPEERAEMAATRLGAKGDKARGFGDPQQSDSFDTSLIDKLAKFSATSGHTPENALVADDEFDVYAQLILNETKDGSIMVPFFYLGDLFDMALDYLSHLPVDEKGHHGSFQFLLSTMDMVDPLLAYQVKNFEIECGGAEARRIIKTINDVDPMRFAGSLGDLIFGLNIGSVPISLNYFQEWFVNKVIRPGRVTYPFLSFVKDVCAALISKAFNSVCFKDALTYQLRFDTANFDLDASFTNQDVDVYELTTSKAAAETLSRKVLDRSVPDATKKGISAQRSVIPSLLLYSVDSRPRGGTYEEDLESGIYHYFLGAACGLPKSIKFNRLDQPYIREGRILKHGSLGAQQLRELYSVTLDMVGNTLHKNGQYLYIEPIGVGLGSRRATGTIPNLARMLGIGGYHLVTAVKSSISSAGFNVVVEAMQEGMSFSDSKIVSIKPVSSEGIYRSTFGEHGIKDNFMQSASEYITVGSGWGDPTTEEQKDEG